MKKLTYLLLDKMHESMAYIHNGELNGIVMHPKIWDELRKENADDNGYIHMFDVNPRFGGIEVFRSLDIKEDKFKIF